MQCIPLRSNMVRSYLDLTIKYHDYSSFFTAFDVATNNKAMNHLFQRNTEFAIINENYVNFKF